MIEFRSFSLSTNTKLKGNWTYVNITHSLGENAHAHTNCECEKFDCNSLKLNGWCTNADIGEYSNDDKKKVQGKY